jgi:hypothetical protein
MKTLNFNIALIGVDGAEVPGSSLAKTLSEIIATETEGKTLKLYGWHKQLQVGEPLVLDESDAKDLTKLIEENKRLYIYVKGQLLNVIDKS